MSSFQRQDSAKQKWHLTCASIECTDKASSLRRPNGIRRVRIMAIVNPSPPLLFVFVTPPPPPSRRFLFRPPWRFPWIAITSPELEQCEGIVFIPKPFVMQLLLFLRLRLLSLSRKWQWYRSMDTSSSMIVTTILASRTWIPLPFILEKEM